MTDDDMLGETSREGARRMGQLRQASLTCGASPHAFIDPTTASLVYLAPASSQYRGHLVTTLASTLPPRQLPAGQPGFIGREASVSPDGRWVTVFHPQIGQPGGVLAMYDSSILSPVSITGKVVPIATFNLSNGPLATIHNHSPRLHTAQGRGPAIGPRFQDGHEDHGPSITVICADGIYLFHPFLIDTSLISGVVGNSQSAWRMQMLKCPFHTRFRAVMGGQLAEDTGLRARRAWTGAVAASEAVWVGIEVEKEVRVIRVEYEQDDAGRFSMTTVPLPALPCSPPKLDAGETSQQAELQGLVFVSLSDDTTSEANEGEDQEPKPHTFSDERVGAVRIFRDTWRNGEQEICRTRLEACRIENREFELAEGFKELSNDHSDSTKSWDWVTLSRSPAVSTSPERWTTLALHPLPSLQPSSLALALLNTPGGIMLSHLDLMDNSQTSLDGTWTALRGSLIRIHDDVGLSEVSLCLSQGVSRGELGLVAILSKEFGAILTVGPRLDLKMEVEGEASHLSQAMDSARSIVLAMDQGHNWTDAVRASLARAPHSERTEMGDQIIRQSYQQLHNNINLDELRELLELQTAVYASLHDTRHTTASELLRLLEASYLFTRCATKGPGKTIAFDLASVWPLITVADWVGGVLAGMMRSVVFARGQLEWLDGELPAESTPIRLLYLVHPTLRSLVIRLHSQLNAFTHFVLSIDKPIAHPGADISLGGMIDPRATMLAKANVVDILGKEGVDLIQWGKAIEGLPQSAASESETSEALLKLSCDPLKASTPDILSALPIPSALLRSTSRFSEHEYDAITYEPLAWDSTRLARCDRCGWKTCAIGNQGWVGLGSWGSWRREQETLCMCGGAWIRESKRVSQSATR